MALNLLLLAAAGAVGTLARYGLTSLTERVAPEGSAWGSIVVNVLGSCVFGLALAAAEERAHLDAQDRLIILTGLLGAFTTFSTFAGEIGRYMHAGAFVTAGLHLLLTNALGVGAFLLGYSLLSRS